MVGRKRTCMHIHASGVNPPDILSILLDILLYHARMCTRFTPIKFSHSVRMEKEGILQWYTIIVGFKLYLSMQPLHGNAQQFLKEQWKHQKKTHTYTVYALIILHALIVHTKTKHDYIAIVCLASYSSYTICIIQNICIAMLCLNWVSGVHTLLF